MCVDDGTRGWGPELRVESRRVGGGAVRSKWLRDEKGGEWVHPNHAFNARHNFSGSGRENSGSHNNSVFQKYQGKMGGPSAVNVDAEGSKNNDKPHANFDLVSIFQNPQFYFAIKSDTQIDMPRGTTNDKYKQNDYVMIIDQDRKRQHECNDDNINDVLNDMDSIFNNYLTSKNNVGNMTSSKSTTSINRDDLHFLWAGQAYREQ